MMYFKWLKYIILIVVILLTLVYLIIHWCYAKNLSNARADKGLSYVQTPLGTIAYDYHQGKNDTTLIFIGGAGLGLRVWKKNFHVLKSHNYHQLRYDHFGRGFSDRLHYYDEDILYKQFKYLLQKMKVTKPIILVAYSMGAKIAYRFINENPKKVNKLVLIDPVGVTNYRPSWYLKNQFLANLATTYAWLPRAIDNQMDEFYNPENFPEYREMLQQEIKIEGYKEAQIYFWTKVLNNNDLQEIEAIGKLDIPILLIWGVNDTRISVDYHQVYLEKIPQTIFRKIPKAGHASMYEQSALVNSEIKEFLR